MASIFLSVCSRVDAIIRCMKCIFLKNRKMREWRIFKDRVVTYFSEKKRITTKTGLVLLEKSSDASVLWKLPYCYYPNVRLSDILQKGKNIFLTDLS